MRKRFRQFDLEPMVGAMFLEAKNPSGAIDVPLHEMATETALRGKRTFDVNWTGVIEQAEVGSVERFLEQIKG
jgi:hypothetical protein